MYVQMGLPRCGGTCMTFALEEWRKELVFSISSKMLTPVHNQSTQYTEYIQPLCVSLLNSI